MKKQDLLEIKMMFLEALNEFANGGVSTMSFSAESSNENGTEEGNEEGNEEGQENGPETEGNKGGGSNTAANSGGTPENGRPKPDAGVGVF